MNLNDVKVVVDKAIERYGEYRGIEIYNGAGELITEPLGIGFCLDLDDKSTGVLEFK